MSPSNPWGFPIGHASTGRWDLVSELVLLPRSNKMDYSSIHCDGRNRRSIDGLTSVAASVSVG